MKKSLRVQCPSCGSWNLLKVETAILSPYRPRSRVERPLIFYLSQKTQKCTKCETVLTETDEVFKIIKGEAMRCRIEEAKP